MGDYLYTSETGIRTLVHRVVAEKYLERPLSETEVVHHINYDKQDNRIVNLIVFETNSDHTSFHMKHRAVLRGIRAYEKDKDMEKFTRVLYAHYGIVFYGPVYQKKINKNALNMAERMKKELGIA